MADDPFKIASEGTIVQVNDKVYLFKDDFKGQEISPPVAKMWLADKLGRDLTTFEASLMLSRPLDGSTQIMLISALVPDNSSRFGVSRRIIGYLITKHVSARSANYGDINETQGFYDSNGKLYGELRTSRRQEPGLQAPLIDPIDLVAGAAAGLVVSAVKAVLAEGVEAASGAFRSAMVAVEKKLLSQGASAEATSIRELTEEELSKVWGGSASRSAGVSRPLTDNQVQRAIQLLRAGQDVRVESIGQMRQIQGELGQLGVRSESTSTMVPQRPASAGGVDEIPGSFRDGRGTYRVDPPHNPGATPYNAHNDFWHINITLANGKTLAVVVTGAKSF